MHSLSLESYYPPYFLLLLLLFGWRFIIFIVFVAYQFDVIIIYWHWKEEENLCQCK